MFCTLILILFASGKRFYVKEDLTAEILELFKFEPGGGSRCDWALISQARLMLAVTKSFPWCKIFVYCNLVE
jgi:hypothetical protein